MESNLNDRVLEFLFCIDNLMTDAAFVYPLKINCSGKLSLNFIRNIYFIIQLKKWFCLGYILNERKIFEMVQFFQSQLDLCISSCVYAIVQNETIEVGGI